MNDKELQALRGIVTAIQGLAVSAMALMDSVQARAEREREEREEPARPRARYLGDNQTGGSK